jgi:Ca2+-transporting ATPase
LTDTALDATNWYRLDVDNAIKRLRSRPNGLSDAEAKARLASAGPNELVDRGTKHPLHILWEQLTAVMVLILIGALVLSLFLGKFLESGAILAIVILFAILGFIQEYRAEKAIAALKKLAVPNVRVYRGALREISARDLAPGDVIALEAGNIVPADVRIIESVNLRIQEAALTGESEPVEKETYAIDKDDVSLGDRRNMGYMGTQVTYGRGTALVVATGMRTELGKIATLLQDVKSEMTPLQQRLDGVGKQLAVAGIIVAVLVMAIGLIIGETLTDMLLTAISVAVAVIPEGLPAVVTFTLAIGAQRMLKRNALIRKLPAVETLGSVTTICSDKTGTLTENRMTVTVIDVVGHRIDLTESIRNRMPAVEPGEGPAELLLSQPHAIRMLLAGGALCNDARLQADDESGKYHTIGDPTEGALLVAAVHGGMTRDDLHHAMPRVAELPFDSDRKRMTTVHARPSNHLAPELSAIWGTGGYAPEAPFIAITKGAVDGLLDVSTHVWQDDHAVPMNDTLRQRIQAANDQLARNGMRVLGVTFRPLPSTERIDEVETELIFIGLFGMIDPPRPEVREAVQTCTTAGIRPVMITGDHPLTARYIARDLGIAKDDIVVTGAQLNQMSDAELEGIVEYTLVFARVSPEHKLKIVEALRKKGHVVAMTGDGVNDAPALKKADIGVAMGITGTDVSKEASDMVLRDDNFATIVAAVEEGRVIYDNLRRFVKFVVAGNIGKVAVMLFWPLLFVLAGRPLTEAVALLPLQLLWLNLMTDGLLGLGMGFEPAEKNVMRRPPHSPKAGIFSGGLGIQALWTGVLIGVVSLGVGYVYYTPESTYWQTMIFATLAFVQIFQALATRSSTESLFSIGVFSNRMMWMVIGAVVLFQLIALYTPLAGFLGLQALAPIDLLVSVALGLALFVAVEIEKFFIRQRGARTSVPATSQA